MVANLLVAGHDTTGSQIGCTLFTLLSRPDVLESIGSNAGSIPAILNETIRFEPSISAAPRTVLEPLEICGIERPRSTVVFCNFLTANRDPETWHDGILSSRAASRIRERRGFFRLEAVRIFVWAQHWPA